MAGLLRYLIWMMFATFVPPRNRGDNTMKNNLRSIRSLTMLVVLVLAVAVFSVQPVLASGPCPAPGGGGQEP